MVKLLKINGEGLVEVYTMLAGSLLTIVFGTWIPLMTTLLVLNISDVLTGVLKGGFRHDIGSRIFYAGIKKKVGQWMLIIVGNAVDVVAFDGMPVAKTLVVSFMIGTEGISIVENLAIIGVPIPNVITKYLVQIKEASDKTDADNVRNDKFNSL